MMQSATDVESLTRQLFSGARLTDTDKSLSGEQSEQERQGTYPAPAIVCSLVLMALGGQVILKASINAVYSRLPMHASAGGEVMSRPMACRSW